MHLEPTTTIGSYVSYALSGWNRTLADWGYPLLDVVIHDDGEWGLIEWLRTPLLPAQTPWQWALTPTHRYDLTIGTVKQYIDQCDLQKRHVWDEMEAREKQDLEDMKRDELRMTEQQRLMYQAISRNPDLMNRIAKNGMGEMGLRKLSQHIPNHHYRKDSSRGHTPIVLHLPKPSREDLSAGVGSAPSEGTGADLRPQSDV